MSETQSEREFKHKVRIHIDQKQYESPNPTTGEALYALGDVPAGLKLYREVRGDKEDPPIPNGPEVVHLKEDEHFHQWPPEGHYHHRERHASRVVKAADRLRGSCDPF